MKVLIATQIFPNLARPEMAPYNRHQFAALAKHCDVDMRALIPVHPASRVLDRWRAADQPNIPKQCELDGLRISHSRVLYIPKIGQVAAGATYFASLAPQLLPLRGKVDVVLGSFAYPDGWAAVFLGRLLGAPTVIKFHGSDINVLPKSRLLRPNIRFALSRAAAVVAPSRPLLDAAVGLGATAQHSRVVMNGVNTRLFRVRERGACRRSLGEPEAGRMLLFVGRLEPEKGVDELLEAFRALSGTHSDARLVLVGDGVARGRYESFVLQHSLNAHFIGARDHDEIATWLGASDLLTLPSWAEGTPNVVIEALVSGRRVVATDVGGIPHVVPDPLLGELVPVRDPSKLRAALGRALDESYNPGEVAKAAGFGDWSDSAQNLLAVLQDAAHRYRSRAN